VRLTLVLKLALAFGAVLLATAIGTTVALQRTSQMRGIAAYMVAIRVPTVTTDYDLALDLELTQTRTRDAILANGDTARIGAAKQDWEKQWAQVDQGLDKEQQYSVQWVVQANRDRLAFIKSQAVLLRQDQAEIFRLASESSAEAHGQAVKALYSKAQPRMDTMNVKLSEWKASRAGLMSKEGAQMQASARSIFATLVVCLAVILTVGMVSAILVRNISKSLHVLTQMIQNIAEGEGDVTQRLEAAGAIANDELGDVSRLLNVFMDKLQEILRGVSSNTRKLTAASERVLQASEQITTDSRETTTQSMSVSSVTQRVTENLQSLATGAGEMTTTIQSIAANTHDAAKMAASAVGAAQAADATIAKLGHSSAEIGAVSKVITAIAEQTNLLALNATIEAARAGEAGKGFAVVANEVKTLAKQTAGATDDINRKIGAIREDTQRAIQSIATVNGVIQQINDISTTIATAVEEQSATTNNMTRNTNEAADGAGDISVKIGGMNQAAESTLSRAQETQNAAQELASIATHISTLMRKFKIERSDKRVDVSVSVRISAIDAAGHSLQEEVRTINISRRGARLTGIRGQLRMGSQVTLARSGRQEQFLIVWVKGENGSKAREIGVTAIEASCSFWNDLIETQVQDGPGSKLAHRPVAARPEPTAQRA
jgi:methyl-accepting chemotaxis protein